MRSSNPVFQSNTFRTASWDQLGGPVERAAQGVMTLQGTINKTALLLVLAIGSAAGAWWAVANGHVAGNLITLGGVVIGLIASLAVMFAPRTAPIAAPVYGIAQGAVMGAVSLTLSAVLEAKLGKGAGGAMVVQAVALTFGVFAAMLLAYTLRVIRIGPVAAKVLFAILIGSMLFGLVALVASLFGATGMISFLWSSSPLSIGLSVVMVVVASLFLVMDFQQIEDGVRSGAPKEMEWLGAFGLMVTLLWLYFEILRLLFKLKNRE